MLSRYGIVLGLLLSLVSATSHASPAIADDLENEADHEALRKLKAVAEEAINNNQLDLLKPYLDDNFTVVTYTDREFTDFEVFKDRWQQTRDELLPERSLIMGDIAVARGDSENVLVTGGGRKYRFPAKWSAVCRKVDGE